MLAAQWLVLSIAERPFRNLTSLRLTLSAGGDGHPRRTQLEHMRSLRGLGKALLDTAKLQTLALTIDQGPADEELLTEHAFAALPFMDSRALLTLQTLELEGLAINMYELSAVLRYRRSTLRQVRLRWIKGCKSKLSVVKDMEELEDSEVLSEDLRAKLARILGEKTMLTWVHVYDGKPWIESQRRESHNL